MQTDPFASSKAKLNLLSLIFLTSEKTKMSKFNNLCQIN